MKKHGVLLLSVLLCICSTAQNRKLDSVQNIVRTGNPRQQFEALTTLADYYSDNNLGQSMYYARLSLQKAQSVKDDTFMARAYNSIANVYQYKSQIDSAVAFHRKALAVRQKIKDWIGIADTYNNIGIAYDQQANFPEALRYYFKALAYYDQKNLPGKQAMTYTNIGIVYKAQKEYKKALQYYQKAYEAYLKTTDEFGKTVSAGNLGSILINFGRYEESLQYSEIARKGYLKIDGDRFTAYPLSNMAIVYDSLKKYDLSNRYYDDAIRLHEQYNNGFEVSEITNAFAASLIRQQKYPESIAMLHKAIGFAKSSHAHLNLVQAYKNLSEAQAKTGNFKEAYYYANRYNKGKDSLFAEEKTKAVFEMETKYESEKKEHLLQVKEAEAQQQKITLTGVSLLALASIAIVLLLFRQQRLKNAQLQQEYRLKTAIAQIETQNKLQEQRLGISRDLHDNIGAQLTFIISSIGNIRQAFDLQPSKLNDKLQGISNFTQSTIIELRDTIWAMNHNSIGFDDLRARILNFVKQAREASDGVEFNFTIDPKLEEMQLTSVAGMNIYRTVQEAVHNAVKYSEADRIAIAVDWVDGEIRITITDNGIGFDKEQTGRGNGLPNMEKRMESIGGLFGLHSEKQKGTQIILLFNPTENVL